ncbi:hypothetical protein FNV43_RR26771 [Rhamnella rubrinervis]|uniref:Uncharacterized protein n=1 Tax=Rhamnella rubrinervis TaxID=2594499 RepID=A0A8K0DJ65_9ROSA|nr:hypothetical protein FNV43_RR26771 [Rhamnella rubrinervis]
MRTEEKLTSKSEAKCRNPIGYSAFFTEEKAALLLQKQSSKVPNLKDFVPFCFVGLYRLSLYLKLLVMEPSKVLGDAEKCISSSESGWTMYICSQVHNKNYGGEEEEEEDDNDVYFVTDKEVDRRNDNKDDDESDDSMASDASSGPTLHELPCEEGRLRNQRKYFSGKKACKQEKNNKREERRIKGELKQSVHKADSAASQV